MVFPVPFTKHIQSLPMIVPFTSPEQLERARGVTFQLRLGANESPFGPSPLARDAMMAAVNEVNWYGDPESYHLRTALAERHSVPMSCISVGCGIDDLLGLIARLFLEPGESVVTSHGAYPTFQYHVVAYGGRLITVPYGPDYRNDLAALVETAKDVNAKMLYLANPDNPTGTVHSFADIQDAMSDLPEDCLLLLDEAYIEFASDCALSPDAEIDPRIIRFRTFSKVHGMAGARVGYVLANDAVVAALDKVRNHFGLNRVSQAGALASLGDASFLQHVVAETSRGRDEYAALATKHGLKPIPSSTNFVLIDVEDSDRAAQLVGQLANHGVFIRMPGVSPLNHCIRVTVGTSEQRALFADVFSRCIEA